MIIIELRKNNQPPLIITSSSAIRKVNHFMLITHSRSTLFAVALFAAVLVLSRKENTSFRQQDRGHAKVTTLHPIVSRRFAALGYFYYVVF